MLDNKGKKENRRGIGNGSNVSGSMLKQEKAYQREYRLRNRDKINSRRKELARREPGQGTAVQPGILGGQERHQGIMGGLRHHTRKAA